MGNDVLMGFCAGNQQAVDLITGLWRLFCVWDNCVDQDKPLDEDAINNGFLWAMFGLHENAFYTRFEAQLKPAIYTCVASWIVANKFEKTSELHLLERAYVMRCSPYELFGTIALLSGGFPSQIKAVEYFQSIKNEDTLQSYLQEHRR